MNSHKVILSTLLLFAVTGTPLLAHHGVASSYDASRIATIQGVITKVEWLNPHVWISMEIRNPNGSMVTWRVEIGAPNSLLRDGLRPASFELAKSCTMEVWLARDGSKTANGRALKFAGGRTLDVTDKFDQRIP